MTRIACEKGRRANEQYRGCHECTHVRERAGCLWRPLGMILQTGGATCGGLHPREIPRLRVPALRAKAKTRDTPLGIVARADCARRQRKRGIVARLRRGKTPPFHAQARVPVPPKGQRIFLPRPERTSSTPSSAVVLCRSITGLISTSSKETIAWLSAIISIARCASR